MFSSISFALSMSNCGFFNHDKFKTPVRKFYYHIFKFKIEFKTVNIQYHIYWHLEIKDWSKFEISKVL